MNDSLFTILFLIIAGIVAFFNQKAKADRERQAQQDSSNLDDTQAPGEQSPARPAKPATSWEAELRRMLEGEDAESAPPPPPRPPPTIVVARPVQPPIARPVVIRSAPPPVPVDIRRVPEVAPAPRPSPRLTPNFTHIEVTTAQLAKLPDSQQAYARASQLDKTMSQHIDQVPGQLVAATSVTHRNVSQEITQVVALFKNPHAARQAVLASVIFGPPRSIEEAPSSGGISW